jgi:hypothetical protein
MKRGYYRRIPVFVKELAGGGAEVEGRNWFYNILVDIMLWIDIEIIMVEEFDVWIEE